MNKWCGEFLLIFCKVPFESKLGGIYKKEAYVKKILRALRGWKVNQLKKDKNKNTEKISKQSTSNVFFI